METKMKAGRESVKNKVYEKLGEIKYQDNNKFNLTADQAVYLKQNGIVHRFVHRKQYMDSNNFHKSGWRVVPDTSMPGSNSEGLVVIGDLVLAVKTSENQAAHRKALLDKNKRYTNQKTNLKQAADDLKRAARKIDASAEVHEGYEENDNDED